MNRPLSFALSVSFHLAVLGFILPTKADTPAFVFGGASTNAPMDFTGTRGWAFGYSSAISGPVTITQLGVFDNNGDGLANAHEVGFWSMNGTLLASVTIPAGTVAPLVGGFRNRKE